MKRRYLVIALLALGVLAAGWWWGFGPGHRAVPGRSGHGTLSAAWRGTFTGRAALPASVRWCPADRYGILDAIAADTGVEIVFYDRDSLTAGQHPVVAAGPPPGMPRPSAAVAFRWSPGNDSLEGFHSGSGISTLRWDAGELSGTVDAHLQAARGFDTLRFSASFDHLPVTATGTGCS